MESQLDDETNVEIEQAMWELELESEIILGKEIDLKRIPIYLPPPDTGLHATRGYLLPANQKFINSHKLIQYMHALK